MSTSTGVLAPLRNAMRVDRTGLRPAAAARASAGVLIPLIVGVAVGQPTAGATAAFGALSVGVAVITADPRTPGATMLAASLGMGTASFIGSVSGLVPPVHLVVLAAAGFIAGLLVAAGRGATQVGVNATIALLVFGRFAAGPGPAAVRASWVLAGGLLETGFALLLRNPRSLRSQRAALAVAYDALAQAATLPPSISVAEAAAAARDAIDSWIQSEDRPGAEPLSGLVDELDRIRQEFHALHFQRSELTAESDDRRLVDDALALMTVALHEVAAALRQSRVVVGIEQVAAQLAGLADLLATRQHTADQDTTRQDTADHDTPRQDTPRQDTPRRDTPRQDTGQPGAAHQEAPPSPAARFLAARIAALAGQLRAVDRMVSELSGVRRITLPVAAAHTADAIVVLPSGLRDVFRQVWAATSPSSPAFRHAVRLAVVIPLATEISKLLPWQRAYWLPVTAVIVLKPDFTATVSRGVARTIGTGIGVIAAAVIVATVHPQGTLLILLVAACTWLGYTVFAANYAVYAIFLTSLVILLVSAAERSAISTVENRGFDTLIGGGIAILAYLIWPTWEARTLQAAAADRFEALRRYLDAVLKAYLEPQAYDAGTLARHAAATRRSQSAVTASLERARGEPSRARPDVTRYAGVVSAGRRIVAGTHALASHLRDAKRQVAVPAAATIAEEIDESMCTLVRAIRSGEKPGPMPDLRQSQRQLTAATAAGLTPADRRGAILAALLDPVVDSIDTAADLLSDGPADSALPGSDAASPPVSSG